MGRLLWRLVVVLGAAIALLIAVFIVGVSLEIEIDLSPLRAPAERIASAALDRDVQLAGRMTLVPTFSPTARIEDLRVGDPANWQEADFVRMRLAHVELAIWPLLRRRLVIREVRAEEVELALRERADGSVNWRFPSASATPPLSEPAVALEEPAMTGWEDLFVTAFEVERFVLQDIRISFHGPDDPEPMTLVIRQLDAQAATDKAFGLRAEGSYRAHPYRFSLEGGAPYDLWFGTASWPLEVAIEIAATRLAISGTVDAGDWMIEELVRAFLDPAPSLDGEAEPERFAEFEVKVEGERLDSLDTLLGVALPPLERHAARGRFTGYSNGRFNAEIMLTIKQSDLVGTLELEMASEPPKARLELTSQSIQLADIQLGDWSPFEGDATKAPPPTRPGDSSEPLYAAALLSRESLALADVDLDIRIAELLSGPDRLGAARVQARLQDGALAMGPLQIELPGGSVAIDVGIDPRPKETAAHLRFAIDSLDYGVMARRVDAGSEMAGQFSLDIDLETRFARVEDLMAQANGTIDLAIFPDEFEAGIFDLWAVNLLTAALPEVDKSRSKVNCVVGLFDIRDGRLQEKALLIDTSKMSVGGTVRVDFQSEALEVVLKPTAKKPEFFSLATPVRVKGHIRDFEFGANFEDIVGTLILFATSPVHVPARTLFKPPLAPDGREACMAAASR